jgi:hypothetical protein
MQADRRSAAVSPENIETPLQRSAPVGEHGSSSIRALAGMGAVSTGCVWGDKHAMGTNVGKMLRRFLSRSTFIDPPTASHGHG